MFYTFSQNNSGGSFVQDENISHYVIIEASSAAEANSLAEGKGLYFDGSSGDCPCCGNRWSEAWSCEGDDVPSIYETPVAEYRASYGFMSEYETVVHYLSGKVEYYTSKGELVDRKLENLG